MDDEDEQTRIERERYLYSLEPDDEPALRIFAKVLFWFIFAAFCSPFIFAIYWVKTNLIWS